jgi:PTS system N-acetylgalactosamine-specific IIA component
MSEAHAAPAPEPSDSMAGRDPVCGIVAGHGDLAAGLVSAVAQITGRGSLFVPLSNRGMGGEQLEEALRDALAHTGARLVFTDLPGGSWTIAARRVQRADPSVVLVTGVSLPMLLDCAFREDAPVGEVAQGAVDKARGAMMVAGGTHGH